jgi:hypothetical protein
MPDNNERKQVGTKISVAIYDQMKAIAAMKHKQVGELIDEACGDYIAKEWQQLTPRRTIPPAGRKAKG